MFGDSNTWGHNPIDCLRALRKTVDSLVKGIFVPEYEIVLRSMRQSKQSLLENEDKTNGFKRFRERF